MTWAERRDAYVNQLKQERRAEAERNALANILRAAYEEPQAAQPARPFVDEQAQFMGVESPRGMLASEAMPARPGGLNMQNAISALLKGGRGDMALQLATMMEKSRQMGGMPADVLSTQWLMKQPEDVKQLHFENKRAPNIMNLGGTMAVRGPTGGINESYTVTPKPEQMPSFQAAQATAKEAAKYREELKQTRPKTEMQLESAGEKASMLDDLIDKAKGQAGFFTTGFMGQVTSGLAGTPAHNLKNTLATIKANIGFDRLQEMRDNSKTGGALGQVSEMENKLLQSVWGALEQSQTSEQFKENLERVRKQVKSSWSRVRDAYKKDYGVEYNEKNQTERERKVGGSPTFRIPAGARTGTDEQGRKVFSTDGGKTVFDATTGQRIK